MVNGDRSVDSMLVATVRALLEDLQLESCGEPAALRPRSRRAKSGAG